MATFWTILAILRLTHPSNLSDDVRYGAVEFFSSLCAAVSFFCFNQAHDVSTAGAVYLAVSDSTTNFNIPTLGIYAQIMI